MESKEIERRTRKVLNTLKFAGYGNEGAEVKKIIEALQHQKSLPPSVPITDIPSEEEIEKECKNQQKVTFGSGDYHKGFEDGWYLCAKWMRDRPSDHPKESEGESRCLQCQIEIDNGLYCQDHQKFA